jgi:hypothetical protein
MFSNIVKSVNGNKKNAAVKKCEFVNKASFNSKVNLGTTEFK